MRLATIQNTIRNSSKISDPFITMWVGSFGRKTVANYHTELTLDADLYTLHLTGLEETSATFNSLKMQGFLNTKKSSQEPSNELHQLGFWQCKLVLNASVLTDYGRLNALTKRDTYQIRRMDECINLVGKSSLFRPLDPRSGYRKVEIVNKNQGKAVFISITGGIKSHECRLYSKSTWRILTRSGCDNDTNQTSNDFDFDLPENHFGILQDALETSHRRDDTAHATAESKKDLEA